MPNRYSHFFLAMAFLTAGCKPPISDTEDVASDAANDAIADSGLPSRIEDLEARIEVQDSQISLLKNEVAEAQAAAKLAKVKAEEAQADVQSLRLYGN